MKITFCQSPLALSGGALVNMTNYRGIDSDGDALDYVIRQEAGLGVFAACALLPLHPHRSEDREVRIPPGVAIPTSAFDIGSFQWLFHVARPDTEALTHRTLDAVVHLANALDLQHVVVPLFKDLEGYCQSWESESQVVFF